MNSPINHRASDLLAVPGLTERRVSAHLHSNRYLICSQAAARVGHEQANRRHRRTNYDFNSFDSFTLPLSIGHPFLLHIQAAIQWQPFTAAEGVSFRGGHFRWMAFQLALWPHMLNYNYYAALGFLRLLLVSCSSCWARVVRQFPHMKPLCFQLYVAALITYTTTELLEQHLPYSCPFGVATTPYNGHNVMFCFAGGYGWMDIKKSRPLLCPLELSFSCHTYHYPHHHRPHTV